MSAAEAMSEERRIGGIPIRNLYVMLAFADSLHGELSPETCGAIEQDEFPLDVLARLLAAKLVWIRRRGTPRRYRVRDDVGAMPEGAIDLPSTLRGMHLLQDRLAFQVDELQIDTPQNRLLCAGIRALLRETTNTKVKPDPRDELRRQLGTFSGVTYITSRDALRVEWTTHHATYSSYREALALARLAVLATLPDEGAHDQHWRKLLDNHKRMGKLFEKFIRGFLRLHAADRGSVRVPEFKWSDTTGEYVPSLETDMMLEVHGSGRLTVGECKLYKSPLIDRYLSEGKRLRAEHVNQLFAYLAAAQAKYPSHAISGLLIYALVDIDFSDDVMLRQFPLVVFRAPTSFVREYRWERAAQLVLRSLKNNKALCCSNALTGDSGRWPPTAECAIYLVARRRKGPVGYGLNRHALNAAVLDLIHEEALDADVVRAAQQEILRPHDGMEHEVYEEEEEDDDEDDDDDELCKSEHCLNRAYPSNYGYCRKHRPRLAPGQQSCKVCDRPARVGNYGFCGRHR